MTVIQVLSRNTVTLLAHRGTVPHRPLDFFYSNKNTFVQLEQWFSNFLHQVPPQKIFGFPSTTIMTNIKMHYKWLPTAPGVCSRCVCVCVCVCALWMG